MSIKLSPQSRRIGLYKTQKDRSVFPTDLTSFFSMSTTQSRRPGLSRRRETSPDPKTLVDSIEQNYDWLGTATLGQNDTTKKSKQVIFNFYHSSFSVQFLNILNHSAHNL